MKSPWLFPWWNISRISHTSVGRRRVQHFDQHTEFTLGIDLSLFEAPGWPVWPFDHVRALNKYHPQKYGKVVILE
jgi:hypothetical protein